jgi:hypothetical protein
MLITRYSELRKRILAFSSGDYPLMVVYGRAGICKTTIAREALPEGVAHWISGDCTAASFFDELRAYQDYPIVLDDVDGIHRDADKVRLLKQVCQLRKPCTVTRRNKRNTRIKDSHGNVIADDGELQTRSPILILTNEWERINRHVQALDDRAVLLEFGPSSFEIQEYVEPWFLAHAAKKGVEGRLILDWIAEHLDLSSNKASVRDYEIAVADVRNDLDWKDHLLQRWERPPHLSDVIRLSERPLTVDEQFELFHSSTGLSRTTFQNYRKQAGLMGQHGGLRTRAGRVLAV